VEELEEPESTSSVTTSMAGAAAGTSSVELEELEEPEDEYTAEDLESLSDELCLETFRFLFRRKGCHNLSCVCALKLDGWRAQKNCARSCQTVYLPCGAMLVSHVLSNKT
jgi:hypothetical protein